MQKKKMMIFSSLVRSRLSVMFASYIFMLIMLACLDQMCNQQVYGWSLTRASISPLTRTISTFSKKRLLFQCSVTYPTAQQLSWESIRRRRKRSWLTLFSTTNENVAISSAKKSQRNQYGDNGDYNYDDSLSLYSNIPLTPLEQVTCKLHEILQQQQQNTSKDENLVAIEGYITHRRKFGSSLAFIDMVSSDHTNNDNGDVDDTQNHSIVQVLLKRQGYDHSNRNMEIQAASPSFASSTFTSLLRSMHPGTKLSIIGVASQTQNPGEVVLLARRVKILTLPRDPQLVKSILKRTSLSSRFGKKIRAPVESSENSDDNKGLNLEEVANAANVSKENLSLVLLGIQKSLLESSTSSNDIPLDNGNDDKFIKITIPDENNCNDINESNVADDNTKCWNQNKVAYATIAKEIVEKCLPTDPNYPFFLLQSKGRRGGRQERKRGSGVSNEQRGMKNGTSILKQQYQTILPMAPSHFATLPTCLHNLLKQPQHLEQIEQQIDNGDTTTNGDNNPPMSVRSLLDKERLNKIKAQSTSFENDLNKNYVYDVSGAKTIMTPATIAVWVQNRRRFRDSITVLEVVDEFCSGNGINDSNNYYESGGEKMKRTKCILHPQAMMPNVPAPFNQGYDNSDNDYDNTDKDYPRNLKQLNEDVPRPVDLYGYLLSPGARVLLKGYYVSSSLIEKGKSDDDTDKITSYGRGTLYVTRCRLLRSSWRPTILRYFLSHLSTVEDDDNIDDIGRSVDNRRDNNIIQRSYNFDPSEVAEALDLPGGYAEARELCDACEKAGDTEIQWRAAELSRRLQDGNSRMGQVSDEMKEVLNIYAGVRDKWPLKKVIYNNDDDVKKNSRKDMNVTTVTTLRKSLEGSRWQRAKRPQLKWMTSEIRKVVEAHPAYGTRPLNILDVGGGRGHLANYLASTLGADVVNVHVIDIDSRTVKNGMMQARRNSLPVRYKVGDASNANAVSGLMDYGKIGGGKVDVVVALHACGALSDVALGHAVTNGASFVVCPCCFRSNPHLLVTVPKKDLSSRKSTETDNFMREGGSCANIRYQNEVKIDQQQQLVSVSTWLGINDRDLEALKKLAEIQGDIHTAGIGIHSLCALRAKAAIHHHRLVDGSGKLSNDRGIANSIKLEVRLKTFPIGFSTRNYIIVGELQKGDKQLL